jgi:hypothetical protein
MATQTRNRRKKVDDATAAKQAAMAGTRSAGLAVAGAARKAKVPLMIGGAATAGLAGGLVAIRTRGARRQPRLDLSSVESAAKQLSTLTGQIGAIAGAMQHRGQSD